MLQIFLVWHIRVILTKASNKFLYTARDTTSHLRTSRKPYRSRENLVFFLRSNDMSRCPMLHLQNQSKHELLTNIFFLDLANFGFRTEIYYQFFCTRWILFSSCFQILLVPYILVDQVVHVQKL